MEPERHHFLSDARVRRLAELCAPLLLGDFSWIERRKESVVLLDDTALRRQVSVDLRLRRHTSAFLDEANESRPQDETDEPEESQPQVETDENQANDEPAKSRTRDASKKSGPDPLWSAPAFVLPKAPANLMAFDLVDESGAALRLLTRDDNARISAACLIEMATLILGKRPTPALTRDLVAIGVAEPETALAVSRRLQSSERAGGEVSALTANERFKRWLELLAHSSVVVVLFRATHPRRKLFKLSYDEPIATKLSRRALVGWDPYRLWVDTPLVEARSYHFEASAPQGLRIVYAAQACDGSDANVHDAGSLRKVHLYRDRAAELGAGTVAMELRVGAGLSTSGVVAALGIFLALLACWLRAPEVAVGPSSAPALLLLFPGLIATFIARPDQHALTSRLLSYARWLLVFAAGVAYLAAARVALGGGEITGAAVIEERTNDLEVWFGLLSLISLVPLAGLAFAALRQRNLHLPPAAAEVDGCTDRSLNEVLADAARFPLETENYELVDRTQTRETGSATLVRGRWYGSWVLHIQVSEAPHGTRLVVCTSELVSRIGRPLSAIATRRELNRIETLMLTLIEPD